MNNKEVGNVVHESNELSRSPEVQSAKEDIIMDSTEVGTVKKVVHESNELSQLPEVQSAKEDIIMDSTEVGTVKKVVHESNELSQSPEVQSARDESKKSNAQDFPDDYLSEHRTFTISKPLSHQEVVQIRDDLYRYDKQQGRSSKQIIDQQVKTYFVNKSGECEKVSMSGIKYDFFEVVWTIKKCRAIIDDSEGMDYVLEIEINPRLFDDSDDLPCDGSSLKLVEEGYIKEAWKKSPLLEDISSCKLSNIEYSCYLYFGKMCPPELIKDLVRQSNIHQNYCEWEMYPSKTSKGVPYMARRAVDIDWEFNSDNNPHLIRCYIQRTFHKPYTWNELILNDSIHTKLIIEQMLSDEYRRRSIATYLKIAFMGGSYYSMERAVKIIESSSLGEDRQNNLISTLEFVNKHGGILNAKMVYGYTEEELYEYTKSVHKLKNKEEGLYNLVNALHELVDLGINPVTIPEKYNIEELSNPIDIYLKHPDNRVGDEKKASSRIEIEEKIGDIDMPCRTS